MHQDWLPILQRHVSAVLPLTRIAVSLHGLPVLPAALQANPLHGLRNLQLPFSMANSELWQVLRP